jgi:hypothetical protein
LIRGRYCAAGIILYATVITELHLESLVVRVKRGVLIGSAGGGRPVGALDTTSIGCGVRWRCSWLVMEVIVCSYAIF